MKKEQNISQNVSVKKESLTSPCLKAKGFYALLDKLRINAYKPII
jgi:hypothetical protein